MARYRRRGKGGPRSARQRAALRKAQLISARKRRKNKVKSVIFATGAVIGTGVLAKTTYYAFHPNGFPTAKRDWKDIKSGYSTVKNWVFKNPKPVLTTVASVKPRRINPYQLQPRQRRNGKRRNNRLGY